MVSPSRIMEVHRWRWWSSAERSYGSRLTMASLSAVVLVGVNGFGPRTGEERGRGVEWEGDTEEEEMTFRFLCGVVVFIKEKAAGLKLFRLEIFFLIS